MAYTMMRNLFYGFLISLFIILLSFTYLGYKYFPKDLLSTLKLLDKKYLSLTLLFLFLFHTFDTLRVIVLARALGVVYPLWYGYLVSLTNTFGATVTPAHLGGEFLPLYTLTRKGGQFYQIMTIVTMKGFSGFFFYLLFFPLTLKALLKDPKQTKEFLFIVGVLLIISLLAYTAFKLLFRGKERGKHLDIMTKLRRTFLRYVVTCKIFFRTKKKTFLLALGLSVLLYFSFLLMGVFLTKAFNRGADIKEVFIDQLPLLYAIFISPTPGGSGVGELGALPIFSPHLKEEYLGLFVMLWRILSQYLSAFFGGLIFVSFLLKDLKKLKEKNESPLSS